VTVQLLITIASILIYLLVEAMKELIFLPLAEEPEILADAVHTWTIEDWRTLSKKEHGPIFEAGGSPWYILLRSVCRSLLTIGSTGVFLCSHSETTSITAHFTSNKVFQMESHQMTGTVVCSSVLSFGTQMIRLYIFTILRIIVSQRMKETGDSQDL
jgi:hypothetical protein